MRGFLADRPPAVEALTKIFLDEIERSLCGTAGVTSDPDAPTSAHPWLGGVSFLHRFGSALNHHVHLHAYVTDGVFVPAAADADMLAWENSGFSVDASVRIALIDRDVPSYFRSLEYLKPRSHDTSRIAWAKLMARMGEEFPFACPNCGGDIQLIAFITEPGPIRKIRTHLGEPLEPLPASSARGPPIDWGELVQAHDGRVIFQASPDELAVIDIHSLEPASDTRRQSHGNVRLGRGLRRREKNAIAEGCAAFWRTAAG